MSFRGSAKILAVALPLFCVALPPVNAAADDISELTRLVLELQRQNLELARRIAAMEAANSWSAQVQAEPSPQNLQFPASYSVAPSRVPLKAIARPTAPPAAPRQGPQPAASKTAAAPSLEQRVRELEIGQAARDAATREIIRDSLAKIGPKINEAAALSGSLEVQLGKSKSFSGPRENSLTLSTAELEFDIKMSDWVTGSLILAYDAGNDVTFTASDGSSRNIDRIVADRALITLGDIQQFPLYAKMGRDTLTFGTSTGLSRTSSLSLASPLTIEAFETRANSAGIGFAVPTPPARPPAPPVVVPDVKPLVLRPAVEGVAGVLGYKPPPIPPPPPTPVFLPMPPPPIYGSFSFFEAASGIDASTNFTKNFTGTLGFRTQGHCGRPYSALRNSIVCPWTFDFHVDYINSVYNSNFLRRGYENFLSQIGRDPGASASLKASIGRFALVAEVNESLKKSTFVDDAGTMIAIRPGAWQVSLGYQFDWNPWVETIGDQGTFIAVGYSRTRDLGGATRVFGGETSRVGAAPKQRAILTVGEWVTSEVKLAADFLVDWDYEQKDGGTGERGYSFLTSFAYNF